MLAVWQDDDDDDIHQGNPCGIMAKVLDCDIIVSENKLHLRYNVHFWTCTLEKSMNLPPIYELNSTITVFLKDSHRIKLPMKVDMPLSKETKWKTCIHSIDNRN